MTEATIRATEITATDPAPRGTVRRQLRRRGAVALGLLAAVLGVPLLPLDSLSVDPAGRGMPPSPQMPSDRLSTRRVQADDVRRVRQRAVRAQWKELVTHGSTGARLAATFSALMDRIVGAERTGALGLRISCWF